MSKETTQVASAGFPLAGILTIIFVIAKLAGAISWSWWWVFAPLWISTAIGLGVFAVIMLVVAAIAVITAIID